MSYICMVVDGSYPHDIRVRKEAETLVENGKKVVVVCPARKGDAREETIHGVEVYRIGKNYSDTKKGILDVIESFSNINPFFYFGLKPIFKKYTIDFLHVHDLPLAGTCYLFKNKVKGELILDLHENYPDALRTWFKWKKNRIIRLKNAMFMNPNHWSKKERKYCLKYDKIICVVEEMKERLIAKFQIDPNKMVVIRNCEKKSFQKTFIENKTQSLFTEDVFSITYVGGFGPHRGLDTAIKGIPYILKEIPHAKLFLVGKGSFDVESKLRDLVKEHKVEKQVIFVGYRPFTEVSAIMSSSNLNIIPHNMDEQTNCGLPHKFFQIMMSKGLLLVSSCKPLKRIVEQYDAGLVFEADSSTDFSEKAIYAYQNKEKLKYRTENAFNAVMNEGENWGAEGLKLVKVYNDLLN
jgi:glycosyltransferase involved in cell wall biosynthesis